MAHMLVELCFDALLAALVASVLLFWLLYFFVVQVRLADANAKVEDTGWAFLWVRWPVQELAAYRALLREDERRRWYNRALLHMRWVQGVLFLLLALSFAATVALP